MGGTFIPSKDTLMAYISADLTDVDVDQAEARTAFATLCRARRQMLARVRAAFDRDEQESGVACPSSEALMRAFD